MLYTSYFFFFNTKLRVSLKILICISHLFSDFLPIFITLTCLEGADHMFSSFKQWSPACHFQLFYMPVLLWAGIEWIFFTVGSVGVRFRFVLNTGLITLHFHSDFCFNHFRLLIGDRHRYVPVDWKQDPDNQRFYHPKIRSIRPWVFKQSLGTPLP